MKKHRIFCIRILKLLVLIALILESTTELQAQTIEIHPGEPLQKLDSWGHDIKQGYHADNITSDAARQIFEEGRFGLLRIPIYCNAHHSDGSLRADYLVEMASTDQTGPSTQWQRVPAEGDWFYLLNKEHDKYLKGWSDDDVELASHSNEGSWTQWKLVDAGSGWYHLESRGHGKYLRTSGRNVHLAESSSTGSWTQWKFQDAGDGWSYLESKGHEKYLKGGGSEYDKIIGAINRASDNGQPELFASVKIYWPEDQNTGRNETWGPFLNENGLLNVTGYAAACDSLFNHIERKTGERIDYLAPVCEQTEAVPPYKFEQVAGQINHDPLIVGPEKWGLSGSESYWDSNLESVVDVKSTHNKDVDWIEGARYNWNGETKGGNNEEFFNFFKELNQSIYEGQVNRIVLWADFHLEHTDDDNRNGPFRRALTQASQFRVLKSTVAGKNSPVAAIAFQTDKENEIKVFYAGTEEADFRFSEKIDVASIPDEATNVDSLTFSMPATGNQDFVMFTVQQQEQQTVDVGDPMESRFLVYPNPASDQIVVQTDDIDGQVKVEMYNQMGGLVSSRCAKTQRMLIPASRLGKGLYFIKISDKQELFIQKIVLQ